MDDHLHSDLLADHADAPEDFRRRQAPLFAEEMARLEPLIDLAERLFEQFEPRPVMQARFRDELRADLIAHAHRQRTPPERWRWAALGTSAAVAAAVVAWRYTHRGSQP